MPQIVNFRISQVCIGICGIAANSLLFFYILREKRKLTVFLLTVFSLSIADFSVSLLLTYSGVYLLLEEIEFFAKSDLFLRIFLQSLAFCQLASYFHVLFISAERLFAVFQPLRFQRYFTRAKCRAVLVIIWVGSLAMSFVDIYNLHFLYQCITLASAVVLVCIYTSICIKIIRQSKSFTGQISERRNRCCTKVSIHSLFIAMSFLICNIPYAFSTTFSSLLASVGRLLIVCNVVMNPMVYFLFARLKDRLHRSSIAATAKSHLQPSKQKKCTAEEQQVPDRCDGNAMPDDARCNTMPGDARSNTMHDNARSNAIPDDVRGNTIPDDARGNAIPDDVRGNAISGDARSNTMPGDARSNAMPGDAERNAMPEDARGNTIFGDAGSNAMPDNA